MICVDYSEAVAAFFTTREDGTPVPEAVTSGSPARQLRDACEPVAMHPVWSPVVNEHLAGLGLDFLGAYVGGRGSVLGDPAGAVVAAAFAWFEPGLVTGLWEAARSVVPPAQLTAAREEATAASLADVLAGEDVAGVADLLADAAEPADGAGRPLFSGLRARGRPEDPMLRLWWACSLAREHRGDSHVAACVAAGLDPVRMGILMEVWLGYPVGEYSGTRAWPQEAQDAGIAQLEADGLLADGAITDAGRATRDAIEAATDTAQQALVTAVGPDLDDVTAALDAWSTRCVEARTFPPDIRKRAAG
jgi:hypothetical protein